MGGNGESKDWRELATAARVDLVPELVQGVLWMVWSFVVVTGLVGLRADPDSWTFVVVVGIWLLSGVVMLSPAAELELARRLGRLSRPSGVESHQLEPAWVSVTQRASVDESRFSLWVVDAGPVPTTPAASAGSAVVVTRWAVHTLPPAQLEAVMAHQLAHQLVEDWRREWSAMVLWYSLPARGFVVVARWLWRLTQRVPALGCLVWGVLGLGLVGMMLTMVILGDTSIAIWLAVYASPLLAPPLFAWFGQLAERRADRVAAELGYSKALLDMLYSWQSREVQHSSPGRRPAAVSRIATLERHLPAGEDRPKPAAE